MEKITTPEIKELMFKEGWADKKNPPIWVIFDPAFLLPSDEEVQKIIDEDPTDLRNFTPGAGDCDNFAFELRMAFGRKGWAVGVIATKLDDGSTDHGVFFYINNKKELTAIEPQSDKPFNKDFRLLAVVMF